MIRLFVKAQVPSGVFPPVLRRVESHGRFRRGGAALAGHFKLCRLLPLRRLLPPRSHFAPRGYLTSPPGSHCCEPDLLCAARCCKHASEGAQGGAGPPWCGLEGHRVGERPPCEDGRGCTREPAATIATVSTSASCCSSACIPVTLCSFVTFCSSDRRVATEHVARSEAQLLRRAHLRFQEAVRRARQPSATGTAATSATSSGGA